MQPQLIVLVVSIIILPQIVAGEPCLKLVCLNMGVAWGLHMLAWCTVQENPVLSHILQHCCFAGVPTWHVEDNLHTDLPSFLGMGEGTRDAQWWEGIFNRLNTHKFFDTLAFPQLEGEAPNKMLAFKQGTAILEDHPYFPELFTPCFLLTYFRRWLKKNGHNFCKFKADGLRGRHSKNQGYIQVKPNTLVQGSTKPFYLHDLICYMFRGPPALPADDDADSDSDSDDDVDNNAPLRAIHLCECKLCFCPWHLAWRSQSENRRRYVAKKRDMTKKGLGPAPLA